MFAVKMKPKLPCCEINKNEPSFFPPRTLECDHCQCVFAKKEQLDDHIREIHEVQFTGKRKLVCCNRNQNKRCKNEHRHHECAYCECAFQKKHQLEKHMMKVHRCPNCGQILLTEEIRAQHKMKHDEEERQRVEAQKRQKERDEDLMFNFVLKNKLDEYQPDPDYQPDLYNIFCYYGRRMEKDQMLALLQKFEPNNRTEFLDAVCSNKEELASDKIIYLLENAAMSLEEVASVLNEFTHNYGDDKIVPEMVAYFLDKGYDIKCEWVAKSIMIEGRTDEALMERIKQKYKYTFDQVYEARKEDSLNCDIPEQRKQFYVEVHKFFPDPDFKDPFADPFNDFEYISTEHVRDHLHNRYFYDEEEDELSIVVGCGERREISLGSCEEMLDMNLEDLVEQYNKATAEYDKANETVNELFAKRGEELDAASSEKEREDILDHYHYEIYKDGALSERNYIANEVSKLYFVIAQK